MTSKQLRGKAAVCKLCGDKTYWYVAILKGNHEATMVKHWFVCLHCYEDEPWLIETKLRELTMKSGSSSGLQKSVSKRKGNHSQAAWEESIRETSSSNSKEKNWWEK